MIKIKNNQNLNLNYNLIHTAEFTTPNKIAKNRWLKYTLVGFAILFFLTLMCGLAAINIRFANNGKYNFNDLFYIFSTGNIFDNNLNQIKNINTSDGGTFGAMSFTDLFPVRKAIWVSIATVIAGMGLAIAGALSQGLTKNPLSDPTTLGATEASIFGAIVMNIILGGIINGDVYQYVFVGFAFMGGGISILFIFLIIQKSNSQINYLKITLVGLAVSIFFRTINFLLRTANSAAVRTSTALAIGGAENIYSLYPSQQTILYLGIGLILISLVVAIIFSRHLTLLELGDEKASGLGINVQSIKVIGLILIFITIPISISLVGNVAFVGLFSPHIIRILFRTRNYRIVLPLAAILGATTMSLGLTLHIFFSSIPSSIYMVFIGAPMLIYLGWTKKGKK